MCNVYNRLKGGESEKNEKNPDNLQRIRDYYIIYRLGVSNVRTIISQRNYYTVSRYCCPKHIIHVIKSGQKAKRDLRVHVDDRKSGKKVCEINTSAEKNKKGKKRSFVTVLFVKTGTRAFSSNQLDRNWF